MTKTFTSSDTLYAFTTTHEEANIEIRLNKDESLDEIVARGCGFHFEQMDDELWWFAVTRPDGKRLSVFLHGKIDVEIAENPNE